jgi:putative permease
MLAAVASTPAQPEPQPPAHTSLGERARSLGVHLGEPQVLLLTTLVAGGLLLILLLGRTLAPVIAGLVVAYVLQGPVQALTRRGVPRLLAVTGVFVGFLALILYALLALGPLLTEQLSQLVVQLPNMVNSVQSLLLTLPERFPELVGREQVVQLTATLQAQALAIGESLVTWSVNRIGNLFSLSLYLFLVPLLVFFFLKDRELIVGWLLAILPKERGLAAGVWHEVDQKTGAYVRGKIFEVGIVGVVTYATFTLLGAQFAALLASLTGLSVLVPYIGVVAAAVPVVFLSLVQFGFGGEFAMVVGAYGVIQILDGNLLAPLLISEAVDLHPVAVVAAILVFGGIWGFWGIFFAIPLATLALAVVKAWPRGKAARVADPPPPPR